MSSANFANFVRAFAKGDIDFDTLQAKVLLVTTAPSAANLAAWAYRADISGEVLTGNGYTVGGIAQAYTLGALDTAGPIQAIIYTNIVNGWTSATFAAVGAIIYKSTGAAATDILMHFIDFGETVSVVNGVFDIAYSDPFLIAGY